jgi:hypothetical protein
MISGADFWGESSAEEVRHGPMVCLAKMIHTLSTFTVLTFKPKKKNQLPWLKLTKSRSYLKKIHGQPSNW